MPDKEALDTRGTNWQNWSIRLPLPLFVVIASGLWYGFEYKTLIHDNENEIQRVEQRLDKIRDRQQKEIEELEAILHDNKFKEQ